MKRPKEPKWLRWAQFRFGVIGILLSCPPSKGRLGPALTELSRRTWNHPIKPHKHIRIGRSTIERWYYLARQAPDPIAALGRKQRSDAGKRDAMHPLLLEALTAQYQAHRRWNVQLHYDNLLALAEENSALEPVPSYKTVLRCMRENGFCRLAQPAQASVGQQRAARRLQQCEVRSYEVEHVHGLWHLDFHQARVRILDKSGTWRRLVVLAILDDHSRLCCHLQFYLAETAECLVHGLLQAFMKRGLPRALMSDNGAAMLSEEVRRGLKRLAIAHKTTLPYSPYQNGKQEAFWGQLESRLVELLRGVEDLSLSFVNQAAQAWVEQDYHRSRHREIGTTPLTRLLAGTDVSRPAPDSATLKLSFTRRVKRVVRRSDATVVVAGVRYELPARLSHLRAVILCYPEWDQSAVTLVDPHSDTPLVRMLPLDKAKNASGIRRVILPVTADSAAVDAPDTAIPALLRKWMADYAATGLPPAYLPKEELDDE